MEENQVYSIYRQSVRIGNWFEDVSLEEHEIKEFLRKREKNQLLIQKTRSLFINFHKKIDLAPPCEHVHFGAVIQVATCMRLCGYGSSILPALSVIINEKVVRYNVGINDNCEMTVAASGTPCSRCCFKITRYGHKNDRTGEVLRYGQKFSLECVDAEEKPLLMYSMQKTPNLLTTPSTTFAATKLGEINIPIGLTLGKNTGTGKLIPTGCVWWRCYHADPKKRFETHGQPIPPFTPVVITHFATNRKLSAESFLIQTLFGPEVLVCLANHFDEFGRESIKNRWLFVVSKETKFEEELGLMT